MYKLIIYLYIIITIKLLLKRLTAMKTLNETLTLQVEHEFKVGQILPTIFLIALYGGYDNWSKSGLSNVEFLTDDDFGNNLDLIELKYGSWMGKNSYDFVRVVTPFVLAKYE